MNTKIFQLSMILVVFLSSCKKESGNQQSVNQPPTSYIKSISVFDTLGSLLLINTHYYDSLHRLIKISGIQYQNPHDSILVTCIFDYSSLKVIFRKTLSSSSQYCDKITYNLNSSGLVESSVHIINATPTDSSILSNDTYQFNSDRYLMTQTTTTPGGTPGSITYYYSSMNADYSIFSPSSSDSKQLFYYDTGHYNTVNFENAGIQFLGKSCYNPLIRARSEALNMNIATYSYEFDQTNRIKKIVLNGNSVMPGLYFVTVPILATHEVLVYNYY